MTQELIPITIKKTFNRDTFPGRSRLDTIQHEAMLTGKTVERSAGDAMFAIKEAKQQLMQRIEHYMNMNKLATTCELPDKVRPAKLVLDILDFVKQINEFIQEVQELIAAIEGVIGYLQMMLNRVVQYLQARLNSLATLIAEICNFNLPDLPAIPSIFGALYFDGFQFPSGAFKFALKFDANFAFGACQLRRPNLDIFRNYPKTKFALGPSGIFGVQPTLNPPLPNALIQTTQTPAQLRTMTTTPVFTPDFFPQDSYVGALPKSNQIISAYRMPALTFKDQVLSLLGGAEGIIADMNPAGTFGATGTSTATVDQAPAGQLDNTLDVEFHRQALQPAVRSYSRQKVTLENIVDSAWDWRVVWAWLTYVNQCREARGGYWIPAFQHAYDTWVTPGFADIDGKAIPWHTDPEALDQIQEGPETPLVFTATLTGMSEANRTQALWMLSYVEASLLGYPRSTRWDSAAPTSGGVMIPRYATGPTRDDLDYQGLPRPSVEGTSQFLLDSRGAANYPSTLVVPEHLATNLQQVITLGFKAVSAAGTYTATRMASRYVYTTRATTLEINYHSQFWKDFVANWNDLLLEAPAFQDIVWNYPEILNSAVNPLADRGLFDAAKRDFLNRDFTWVPGTPYLPTPFIPTLILPPMSLMLAVGAPNGWGGLNDGRGNSVDAAGNPAPLVFSPSAYVARPDIASLPPNVQDTLLFFNQSYADLSALKDQAVSSINAAIADGRAQILDVKIKLAIASSTSYIIPDGQGGIGAGSAPGAAVAPSGAGSPTPAPAGGSTSGSSTTTSDEATMFISPEDSISDIAAIAANGILAAVEKARMVSDVARIEAQKTSITNAATALLPTRPELQAYMDDAVSAWSAVLSYLSSLSPVWSDASQDTVIGGTGFTTLKTLLTTYYGKFIILDQQVKTAQGSAGGLSFTFTQATPLATWVVDHGFHRFPDVTVFDENGAILWAEVMNVSLDRLEVRHGSPRTGSVLCR